MNALEATTARQKRSRWNLLAILLTLALFATIAGAAVLANAMRQDLSEVRGQLEDANATLDSARASLAAERDVTRQLQERYEGLVQQRQGLEEANTALSSQLANEQANARNLQEALSGLRGALSQAEEEGRQLTATVSNLSEQRTSLLEERSTLEQDLSDLTNLYEDLTERAGTADELEAKVEELRGGIGALNAELQELMEQRRPLILNQGTSRGGLLCTGSMEPVLTCLDEATWLTRSANDWDPANITVGAVISFYPDCFETEPGDLTPTAHRVKRIQERNGELYFWPRGDGNPEDDGCWIPASNVRAYLIEVHPRVVPQNTALRDRVNAASAAFRKAEDAYYALRDRYCAREAHCSVPLDVYNLLTPLYAAYDRARNYYNCWYRNAKESEEPGHIPYTCN